MGRDMEEGVGSPDELMSAGPEYVTMKDPLKTRFLNSWAGSKQDTAAGTDVLRLSRALHLGVDRANLRSSLSHSTAPGHLLKLAYLARWLASDQKTKRGQDVLRLARSLGISDSSSGGQAQSNADTLSLAKIEGWLNSN